MKKNSYIAAVFILGISSFTVSLAEPDWDKQIFYVSFDKGSATDLIQNETPVFVKGQNMELPLVSESGGVGDTGGYLDLAVAIQDASANDSSRLIYGSTSSQPQSWTALQKRLQGNNSYTLCYWYRTKTGYLSPSADAKPRIFAVASPKTQDIVEIGSFGRGDRLYSGTKGVWGGNKPFGNKNYANRWVFVCQTFVLDSGECRIYRGVDGRLSAIATFTNDIPVNFGSGSGSEHLIITLGNILSSGTLPVFSGHLDDIRLFAGKGVDGVLNQDDIEYIYKNPGMFVTP